MNKRYILYIEIIKNRPLENLDFLTVFLLSFIYIKMKKLREIEASQFNSCHATICDFVLENGAIFQIFYSYACPELIRFPDGLRCKFTYENSRKAGEKTGSRTTSKQLTQFYGHDWRELRTFNLKKFEELYFDTRLERYY